MRCCSGSAWAPPDRRRRRHPSWQIDEAQEYIWSFARLERPIDFEALDGAPVDLIFLLITPESSGADHLKAPPALRACCATPRWLRQSAPPRRRRALLYARATLATPCRLSFVLTHSLTRTKIRQICFARKRSLWRKKAAPSPVAGRRRTGSVGRDALHGPDMRRMAALATGLRGECVIAGKAALVRIDALPPLRPALAANSGFCEKLRFSSGTLCPPLRAISFVFRDPLKQSHGWICVMIAGLSSSLTSLRVDAACASISDGHGPTRREFRLARLAKTTPLKGADALH